MPKTNLPRLLSPAGSLECLYAAIYGGADDVYFGTPEFNARKNAKNIEFSQLDEAFSFCRIRGVKTNITVNTLLYDREFNIALKAIEFLENNYRPDAYIVQDLGFAAAIKERFPSATLHASTQLEVHNQFGVKLLKSLGFSRIVLAREMTKKEICDVIKCDIETEMFIHGAMCVCQSGGCLMSSFIGKRSGNRGECAYPCRMEYKGTNPFPLSLKDMSLAAHIPEITGLFPDALKLEGRMKSPEYVYEMTLLYRKLLDQNRAASKLEIEHMANVFSRSGFTDGYFTGMRNETMFGIRSEEDKKKTREIDTKIEKSALKTNIYAEFSTGNKSKITLIHDDFYAYAEGATVLQAHSSPLEKSDLITRLSKLGGTPFCVGEIDVSVSENAYLPITEINNLRREGIKILSDMISSSRTRTEGITPSFVPKIAENSAKSGLVLRFDGDFLNLELLQYAARIEIPICNDHVWLSLSEKYAEKLCLILPKTIYSGDAEKIKSLLRSAKKHEILMISIPNITFLPLVEGFSLYGDFSLNITNQNSCLLMQKLGFSQVTVSPEVSPRGFNDIGYIVYGKIPIMHTRNCIIKNISSCKNGLCREKLTDRTSAEFLIYGDFQCTNTIYNSVPIYLLDKPISNIKNPILLFTDENEAEQLNIYAAFCNNSAPDIRFTRGYY